MHNRLPRSRSISSVALWVVKLLTALLASMGAIAFRVPPAGATDYKALSIPNTTGQKAAGLHVTFSGAGGSIRVDPAAVFALDCPSPAIPSNDTVTNTLDVLWGRLCIEPRMNVAFLAYTPFGPLAVASGYWTDSLGANIGPIDSLALALLTAPPDKTRWVLKQRVTRRQERIVPQPWFHIPGSYCWERWICLLPAEIWVEVGQNQQVMRFGRWVEAGGWKPLFKWRRARLGIARYKRERSSLPSGGSFAKGPPPNAPPADSSDAWVNFLGLASSDDGGVQFRPYADFIGTFLQLKDDLELYSDSTPSYPTFNEITASMALGYAKAATDLGSLIDEADSVAAVEPSPTVTAIRNDLVAMDSSLSRISVQLGSGNFSNGPPDAPYSTMSSSLADLETQIRALGTPRFSDAADNLHDMASAFDSAASYVQGGSIPPAKHGFFLWSQWNGFLPNLGHFAIGMTPHLRVAVNLGSRTWFPSTVPWVWVKVYDRNSNELLDEFRAPLSDRREFDVPMLYPDGTQLRIWFKLPTYLSAQLDYDAQDGGRAGASLINGDVDGNDCVNGADRSILLGDFGTGGEMASSVSSSDLNADGMVDSADLAILDANLGHCGPAVVAVPDAMEPRLQFGLIGPSPFSQRVGFDLSLSSAADVRIECFDVGGRSVRLIASEKMSAGKREFHWDGRNDGGAVAPSGLYFVKASVVSESGRAFGAVLRAVLLR